MRHATVNTDIHTAVIKVGVPSCVIYKATQQLSDPSRLTRYQAGKHDMTTGLPHRLAASLGCVGVMKIRERAGLVEQETEKVTVLCKTKHLCKTKQVKLFSISKLNFVQEIRTCMYTSVHILYEGW